VQTPDFATSRLAERPAEPSLAPSPERLIVVSRRPRAGMRTGAEGRPFFTDPVDYPPTQASGSAPTFPPRRRAPGSLLGSRRGQLTSPPKLPSYRTVLPAAGRSISRPSSSAIAQSARLASSGMTTAPRTTRSPGASGRTATEPRCECRNAGATTRLPSPPRCRMAAHAEHIPSARPDKCNHKRGHILLCSAHAWS
jgi:hypothetical protein